MISSSHSPLLKAPRLRARIWVLPLFATALVGGVLTAPVALAQKPTVPLGVDYRLGVGDELQITVSNHPDVDSAVTIRPDGKITLTGAGDLTAAGKTAPRLAKEIEAILARTLNNARVQVIVKSAAARQARIMGAVKAPNAYSVKANSRVVDLISLAGGLDTKVSRITGRLIRGGKVFPFDVQAAIKNPTSKSNLAVRPDDLVQLDAQDISKQLTVTGSVATPGAFDLDDNLTITQLLARAGGPGKGAALKRAHILRAGTAIPIDLSALESGDVSANSVLNSFKFRPGDVLVVPENTDKINIMGQVGRPASYVLSEDASQSTVMSLLAQAGGFKDDAALKSAHVLRAGKPIPLDLTEVKENRVSADSPLNTFKFQPGDVLVVPENTDKINIVGQVGTPSSYTLSENASQRTVLSLLAEAGGLKEDAALKRAHVLRAGVRIPLDLTDAKGGNLSADSPLNAFKFRPGDVLVVPQNNDKISIIGQIGTPASYDLSENAEQNTVMSLLSKAGELKEDAALKRAYVLRAGARVPLDLTDAKGGNLKVDSPLNSFKFQSGDVLVVPQNDDRVNIMGQVGNPQSYQLSENLAETSILSLLTKAGSPLETADLSNVTLTRMVDGKPVNTTINVKAMREGTAPDNVFLRADDALFVPKQDATVSVIGPVGTPGSYPLTEGETLLSLLAKTGSPRKDAGLRNSYVLRDGKQIPIDLRPTLIEGAIDPKIANFRLQRGDTIVIPDISDQVTVSGSIARPGSFALTDDLTIVSLLARAGNASPTAALNKAFVIRQGINIPLDLNVFLSGATNQPSLTGFRLKPGDTLVVPENKIFYTVVGQVNSPGKFAYPDNPADATVLRALVNANGAAGRANLSSANILREAGTGVTVIPVNLKQLFSKKQQDNKGDNIVLQPKDILFVPEKGQPFNVGQVLGLALAARSIGGL